MSDHDESTGRSTQTVILNEGDVLAQAEIDCLANTEKYPDDVQVHKAKADVDYCFSARNAHTVEKLQFKFEAGDTRKTEKAVQVGTATLDVGQDVQGREGACVDETRGKGDGKGNRRK